MSLLDEMSQKYTSVGMNAIIQLRETPKHWHIMYDKYRNVYYRFAEMPYKLAPNESPYD